MKRYGAEVSGLTYNAATQSFQAKVIFHEEGCRTVYPVELAAPMTADFAAVSRGLVLRARALRAQDRGANVSRLRSLAATARPERHDGHAA